MPCPDFDRRQIVAALGGLALAPLAPLANAQAFTPETLLQALRDEDAEYAKGFTARGTLVESTSSGRDKLVTWTITMGDGKLVLEQRDVEDAEHAAQPRVVLRQRVADAIIIV